jgi:hypothetical protein
MRRAQASNRSPLGGEAFKALAAPDDGYPQFLFQMLDSGGQCGLGHVAGFGRSGEVPGLRKGYQVLQLS